MTIYKVQFVHSAKAPVDRYVAAATFPRAVRVAAAKLLDQTADIYGMRIGAIDEFAPLVAIDMPGVAESRACLRVHNVESAS